MENAASYAFGLQPEGEDADAEGVVVASGVHEKDQGVAGSGDARSGGLDLRHYELEDALAEAGESVFVGDVDEAALPLDSNEIEKWSDETDEDVNGTQPGVERTLDDAGGRSQVSGLAGRIEQALDFAEAVRVADLGVKPAHALCLAGRTQAVGGGEFVEWRDLALEFLAVGAPPQHGDSPVWEPGDTADRGHR